MVRVLMVLAVLLWSSGVWAKTVRGYAEDAPEFEDYVQVLNQAFALWQAGEDACRIEFTEVDGRTLAKGRCVVPADGENCFEERCYGSTGAATEWISTDIKFNRKRTKAKLGGGILFTAQCADPAGTYRKTAQWHTYRLKKVDGKWVMRRHGLDVIVSRKFPCGEEKLQQ